jgi:hypothetical protein
MGGNTFPILKEGNQWISQTGFSPTLKAGSQKPSETVNNFPGGACPQTLLV